MQIVLFVIWIRVDVSISNVGIPNITGVLMVGILELESQSRHLSGQRSLRNYKDIWQEFFCFVLLLGLLDQTVMKDHLKTEKKMIKDIQRTKYIKIYENLIKVTWPIGFGLVYLFLGISTPCGSFNAETWLISECLIIIKSIYIFNVQLHFYCTFLFAYCHMYQVFLSNTNNLHIVTCLQAFLSNTNNSSTFSYSLIICLHTII